jgi:hypothetical protein
MHFQKYDKALESIKGIFIFNFKTLCYFGGINS